MCCEKCVEKVRKALEELDGVRDVVLDQYNQIVTIHGDVDPEKALRRVRRVKKKSSFWRMATQPIQYSGSPATGQVHSKSLVNAYRAPGYHTSAYRAPSSAYTQYLTPPRYTSSYSPAYTQYLTPPRYTSSYSRAYSSPYIDSAYRSGYVEPRGIYAPYGRFAHDDLEYRSRFDRGTPFLQMNDV
jgi:copper chaperone CopZ